MAHTRHPRITPLLPLLACALLPLACDELPDEDPGARSAVTLTALLEPGNSGLQQIRLSHPVALGDPVDGPSTFVSGASVTLERRDGLVIQAEEDEQAHAYVFDRADFPLVPLDTVQVTISGNWQGLEFSGSGRTVIVEDQVFEITRRPHDRSHGFDADTLMFHDPDAELNFTDPAAFLLDWTDQVGAVEYAYQTEYQAVVPDGEGGFVPTPPSRLRWLREEEELAWQWGPYAQLRTPPGPYAREQRVYWGGFVFVDTDLEYPAAGSGRHMGYYRISVRRLSPELLEFFFSTHFWLREFDFDPVAFNLVGEGCRGIVGSCALRSFVVGIVEDEGRGQ